MSYISKLFSTGAVRKTPQRIIQKIANEVHQQGNPTVIEIGAGKGEITNALLPKINSSNYYALEIDPVFSSELKALFPNIHVIAHDALKFQNAADVPTSADYFISSIPLSFYKKAAIEELCSNIILHLKPKGKFIVLFTAFWLVPLLRKAVPGIQVKPFVTLPPYFLAVYQKN